MFKNSLGRIAAVFLSFCLVLGGICIPLTIVAETSEAALTPKPIAFWDFENVSGTTLVDASGNGYNGTLKNSPSFTEGKCGTAIKLNGTNQFVQFPFYDALDFSNTEDFTISLWVKTDGGSNQWQLLAGNGRESKNNWYAIYYRRDDGSYRLSAQNPWADAQIAAHQANAWSHLTISFSSSNRTFSLYANGKKTGTKTVSSVMSNGADYGFLLGCSGASVGEYFKGWLDNVRVYDQALTEAQVKEVYDRDNSVTGDANEDGAVDICDLVLSRAYSDGTEAVLNKINADFDKNGEVELKDTHLLRNSLILDDSLVAYFDFETVTGNTLIDASGNGHNGILMNAPALNDGPEGDYISFDGVNQYVHFDYDADLDFTAADSFTLSLWAMPDTKGGWQMLAGNGRESGESWYGIYFNGTYSFARSTPYQSANIGTRTTDDIGRWQHLSASYDGVSKKVNVYLNGKLTSSVRANDAAMSMGGLYGFVLGCSGPSVGEYYKGAMDNVRVYNRCLADSEILNIYTSEKATEENLPEKKEYVAYEGAWPEPSAEVANIIFDTDMGPDYDDTAAAIMLHNYVDKGMANILAMGCSSSSAYGAAFLDLLNTYYGRPDIPVGTLKSRNDILPTCRNFNFSINTFARYETDILDASYAPDVVNVYRKVLSEAEDSSVTIVLTGMLTNMYDLLRSEPDEYSGLTGEELVAKKVKLVSAMGGCWPYKTDMAEFNLWHDTVAAGYVVDNCPVPIMFSGSEIGDAIATGYRIGETASDNPLHTAYHANQKAWDLTSVMYAVEGLSDYWTMVRGDADIVDGLNSFTENNATGARAYLVRKMDPALIADIFDNYMITPAKNNPDEIKVKGIDSVSATADGVWETYAPHKFFLDGSTLKSATKDSSLTFTFSGDGVDIYGGVSKASGKIAIFLDGTLIETVDTYSEIQSDSCCLYSLRGFEKKEHTLKVVVLDEKNENSTAIGATIDFVKVINCQ